MDELTIMCGDSGFIYDPESKTWYLYNGTHKECAMQLDTDTVIESFLKYNINRLNKE